MPGVRLICREVAEWPMLVWAAIINRGSDTVLVRHGSGVETNDDWCIEGVWAGDFTDGGFDLTDVVAGTGIRIRDGSIVFVSSGDTLNRLHHFDDDGTLYVSNSLSALLAIADLTLLPHYDYATATESITNGLVSYVKQIPSDRGPIHLTYFDNIVVMNSQVSNSTKPTAAPDFTDFTTYRDYLFASARRIGENARAPERRHRMTLLASVSSGYDSTAAAVLAREAGAREAVTIRQARRVPKNLFDLDDSGAAVARDLGMTCEVYSRTRKNYPFEDALWASMGNIGDINMTLFDYPQNPCLLFTGFMGDVLWAKESDGLEPLQRKDTSGARFSECRLELGVIVCSPVFWGCQKQSQILALGRRSEMLPWTLETDYDRPVPRRLAEEAGVRRSSFGSRKRVSSFTRRYGRPLSVACRDDFARFLERRGAHAVSGLSESLSLALRAFDSLVLRRLPGARRLACREWVTLPSPSMFFIWANERRKDKLLAALPSVEAEVRRSDHVTAAGSVAGGTTPSTSSSGALLGAGSGVPAWSRSGSHLDSATRAAAQQAEEMIVAESQVEQAEGDR